MRRSGSTGWCGVSADRITFLHDYLFQTHSGRRSQRFRKYEGVYDLHLYRPGFKGSSGIRVISALWRRRYLDVLAGRMGDRYGDFPVFLFHRCVEKEERHCIICNIYFDCYWTEVR